MRIVAVSVGRPQIIVRDGKQFSSAINRRTVEGPIEATAVGLIGDRVSDDRHHGGPDRAMCCYPREHYPFWQDRLGRELPLPSFGENLTTEGLVESETCVGDVLQIGDVMVQVSQPRQPCFKLAAKHGNAALPAWITELGYTGFYVRVLRPGLIAPGAAVALIDRRHPDWTVARMMQVIHGDRSDPRALEALLEIDELSASWRKLIRRRLGLVEGVNDD